MIDNRSRIFCIGMAKTGTLTMAKIWGPHVRSNHEPESLHIINLIRLFHTRRLSLSEMKKAVHDHILRTNLQVHSSQLNFFILDQLMELFPDSKYILTMREPASWLASLINHQIGRKCNEEWQWLRDFRFRPDIYRHPEEEHLLKRHHLYTLEGYFRYWFEHNSTVINKITPDKLLIIRTNQINHSFDEIKTFVDTPAISAEMRQVHENKTRNNYNILEELDTTYLNDKIHEHCGAMARRFFHD